MRVTPHLKWPTSVSSDAPSPEMIRALGYEGNAGSSLETVDWQARNVAVEARSGMVVVPCQLPGQQDQIGRFTLDFSWRIHRGRMIAVFPQSLDFRPQDALTLS
jgi:hypothetical protein